MGEAVKISYVASATRVRCEMTRAACLDTEVPPEDLLKRAKAKLEAIKAEGIISFYMMYPQRLAEVWQALRVATEEPDDRMIQITLGAGAQLLAGLQVEPSTVDKAVITVACDAPRDLTDGWRWEWFKLSVLELMRQRGIDERLNNAQLYSTFVKVKAEGKVPATAVGAQVLAAQETQGKAFSVIGNKQRREIGVVIRNVAQLRDRVNREAMLTYINAAVKQLSVEGIEYKILKREFMAALQSGLDGPESVGVDLPMVLLAAVGQSRVAALKDFPGAGRITFEIDADKMAAVINGFQPAYYDDVAAPVTLDWLKNELLRVGISIPIAEDLAHVISQAIATQADLNGLQAARGIVPQVGKDPYLHKFYKDAASRASATEIEAGQLNIRDMQQRDTVQSGQLVAELRFAAPPSKGSNIYGDELPLPENADPVIRVGEGIQVRGKYKYYALTDGIPVVGDDSISLARAFMHEGDVNLRTGNINFEGPAEISGSIDAGASVILNGDLTVHGSILSALVRVQGSVHAKSGITTGRSGFVHAKCDINAEFIENSNIVCHGNLTVTKALLNSTVYVGGVIKITGAGGVIAGGKIYSRDSLSGGIIGNQRGAMTFLNIGVDWKAARSAEIKQRRLDKIQRRAQEDRLTLRDIVQRKPGQLTARHKELKEELQERLTRCRTISEKLEALIHATTTQMSYSSTARIFAREVLYTNVNVTLCGQTILVANDLANVAILPKRRRGSFIVPLEEIEREAEAARQPLPQQ